jgi:hypothetical protein
MIFRPPAPRKGESHVERGWERMHQRAFRP